MKVWHLLPEVTYNKLVAYGSLTADKRYANEYFKDPYTWMAEQMRKRLPDPPKEDLFPIWVWKKWSSYSDKPDLRCSHLLHPKTPGILLELDVPEEDVLLSDFDDWHSILNRGPNSATEKEWDDFYIKAGKILGDTPVGIFDEGYPKELKDIVLESWENIFDLTTPRDPTWKGAVHPEQIQGCMWKLQVHHITNIKRFIAR